jgi:flagellin-like protein
MKGVSAVIATILMLMITIAMAGVAYMYISGIFTAKTGVVIEIDETATNCAGTLGTTITVYVRNTGTMKTDASKVALSGTRSDGIAIGSATCGAATLALNAGGGSVACTQPLTGTQGTNRIVAAGPTNTITGSVYCPG